MAGRLEVIVNLGAVFVNEFLYRFRVFRECMRFVVGGPGHSGRAVAGRTEIGDLITCWLLTSRGITGDARETRLELLSVFVNEHRRKAPTWGPPRIPECM